MCHKEGKTQEEPASHGEKLHTVTAIFILYVQGGRFKRQHVPLGNMAVHRNFSWRSSKRDADTVSGAGALKKSQRDHRRKGPGGLARC